MKNIMKRFTAFILSIGLIVGMASINPVTTSAEETTDYTIKVNLGTNCTTIYNKKGKAIKAMICSPSAETPVGTFYIPIKYRWHDMIGNCYAQYCSRITTGILFHSVWYYQKYDKSTMSVAAYNVMGNKASHGCVRLLCKDAKWIYDNCAVGTKIVIFWGDKGDDPIKRPSFTPISNGAFTAWDPTDPDPKNPWRKAKPTISVKNNKIEYGTKFKVSDYVEATDCTGNELLSTGGKFKVSGKVNTKKLGTYKVKVTAVDVNGKKTTKKITFKVVDTKKPEILNVKSKKNVPMGSAASILKGVKARSMSGINLSKRIKVAVSYKNKKVKLSKGVITFKNKGTYTITYKVKGLNKKVAVKTVKYKVTDQRVKFSLTNKTVTINQGTTFKPLNYVKKLTTYKGKKLRKAKNIKLTGTVNTAKPGTYYVTYTATYKGLPYTARQIRLTVKVKEVATSAPETTQPETTQPDTTEPETSEPVITGPEETTSDETTTEAVETAMI